jgi:hypothetical protein
VDLDVAWGMVPRARDLIPTLDLLEYWRLMTRARSRLAGPRPYSLGLLLRQERVVHLEPDVVEVLDHLRLIHGVEWADPRWQLRACADLLRLPSDHVVLVILVLGVWRVWNLPNRRRLHALVDQALFLHGLRHVGFILAMATLACLILHLKIHLLVDHLRAILLSHGPL